MRRGFNIAPMRGALSRREQLLGSTALGSTLAAFPGAQERFDLVTKLANISFSEPTETQQELKAQAEPAPARPLVTIPTDLTPNLEAICQAFETQPMPLSVGLLNVSQVITGHDWKIDTIDGEAVEVIPAERRLGTVTIDNDAGHVTRVEYARRVQLPQPQPGDKGKP